MNPLPEVIEGTWEEISREAERFNGHRLRVTILANQTINPYFVEDTDPLPPPGSLEALEAWVNMPRPGVKPLLDDSRAAFYSEEQDRG